METYIEQPIKVFCYGSLMKGHSNHGFLKGSKFIGVAETGLGYTLVIKELPYLLRDAEGEGCSGELYQIDEKTLDRLDLLEGHDWWYERKEISVYCDGKRHKAWCYLMTPERMGR